MAGSGAAGGYPQVGDAGGGVSRLGVCAEEVSRDEMGSSDRVGATVQATDDDGVVRPGGYGRRTPHSAMRELIFGD